MNSAIETVNKMCEQSLYPELFGSWEVVKKELYRLRIPKSIKEITDEDAQEIGYDNANSFIQSNKDYLDGIGLLSAESFMYLLSKNYQL